MSTPGARAFNVDPVDENDASLKTRDGQQEIPAGLGARRSARVAGTARSLRGSSRVEARGAEIGSSLRRTLLDVLQLSKPRVNIVVLVTVWVGFRLAQVAAAPIGTLKVASGSVLVYTLIGTWLLSTGSSALNQVLERVPDSRMGRTRRRPIAQGRLSPAFGRAFGVGSILAGIVCLIFLVHPFVASLGAATVFLYVVAYTPLKRITSFSLIVGAVAGALPPLIGWAAAVGSLEAGSITLFAIQFIWQVPHFLAIAWVYRSEYARAGYPLLTVVDRTGRLTGFQTLLWSVALVPASLMPVLFGLGDVRYLVLSLILGGAFLASAAWFAYERSLRSARGLIVLSILYLPALFVFLVTSSS